MRPLVEMLDQSALHDDADEAHHDDREQDRQRHGPVEQEAADLGTEPGLQIGDLLLQRIAEEVVLGLADPHERKIEADGSS